MIVVLCGQVGGEFTETQTHCCKLKDYVHKKLVPQQEWCTSDTISHFTLDQQLATVKTAPINFTSNNNFDSWATTKILNQ